MKRTMIIVGVSAVMVAAVQVGAVEKTCDFCHTSHHGMTVLLNDDINQLCSGCHADRLKAGEHRVGISPSRLARDLPLQAGKMTCITCHEPHGKTAPMLRMSPSALCIACHDK